MMNEHAIEAGTFLDRLKKKTSQSHTDLENLPVSRSIVSPDVTIKEYGHYLSLMHDVVKDAEENIFPILKHLINDIDGRKKSKYIEQDLAYLNISKTGYNKALSEKLDKTSQAFAMGIMYVLEGSTLGGRFILKNVNEALGYDSDKGSAYFAGYGNTTGSMWKTFLNYLVQYEKSNNSEKEIIAGAGFAFDEIKRHFTENTPQ